MPPARTAAALACALALCLAHAHARQGQKQPGPAAAEQTRPPAVNTQPFVRLAETGRMMVESGRLGWDTALDMSAAAELNEDGSFKPETVRLEWRAGSADEDVSRLARQLFTAIDESRLLAALGGRAKSARLDARLDRANVTLALGTEFASAEEAQRTALGYEMLLLVGRRSKAGTAEGALYEALKATSDGKVFRVVFEMPKETVAKMTAEMLDRRAARGAASPNQE
jgi:hypothetical protein